MYSFSLRVAFVFERLFSCVDCFTQLFVVCLLTVHNLELVMYRVNGKGETS